MNQNNKSPLSFRILGPDDGIPVVFLHAVGVSSWMWEKFLPKLPDIKALLIDLPGHGQSRDVPWVSLENTAEQVHTVIENELPTCVNIVGISLGSYVGLMLLAQNPEKFRTAFLSGMHAGGMKKKGLMKLMSFVIAPIATTSFFAKKNAISLGVETSQIEDYVQSATQTRSSAFKRATNDVVDFRTPDDAKHIQAKVKFVSGDREHELIKSSTERLAQIVPNGSYLFVKDGGHGWPGKKPDYFAAQLSEHIT